MFLPSSRRVKRPSGAHSLIFSTGKGAPALELHVVAWAALLNQLLFVISDALNLAGGAAALRVELVAQKGRAQLHLAEHYCAGAILHFIEHVDADRSLEISRFAE